MATPHPETTGIAPAGTGTLAVFRGVYLAEDPDLPLPAALYRLRLDPPGRHWSTDFEVAVSYALDVMRRPGGTGAVLAAVVSAADVETDPEEHYAGFVMGPGHFEREVFVRADAAVEITSVTVARSWPDPDGTDVEPRRDLTVVDAAALTRRAAP